MKNKIENKMEIINLYCNKTQVFEKLLKENSSLFNDNFLIFSGSMHHMWLYLANMIEFYCIKNNIKYYKYIFNENEEGYLSLFKIKYYFSKKLKNNELKSFISIIDKIDIIFFDRRIFDNEKLFLSKSFNINNLSIYILKNMQYLYELQEFLENLN